MDSKKAIPLALLALFSACTETNENNRSVDAQSSLIDATQVSDDVPPTNGADLFVWLAADRYRSYIAEPAIHPSAGPHGGAVRTFVNRRLGDSLATNQQLHPLGSAAVKELYNGDTLDGWAVMVKIAADPGADSWYWYEDFGIDANNPVADGIGVQGCAGCHAGGIDYFATRNFGS
jgi:hypothetical protein